jgi:hypothetical protein
MNHDGTIHQGGTINHNDHKDHKGTRSFVVQES